MLAQVVRRHARRGSLDLGDVVAGALAHEPQHECATVAARVQPDEQAGDRPRPAGAAMPNWPTSSERDTREQRAARADQAFPGPAGETVERRLREMRVDGSLVDDRDDVLHDASYRQVRAEA